MLSKPVPKDQAKVFYKQLVGKATAFSDNQIKKMMEQAQVVDPDQRQLCNCTHCKHPVYLPMGCKECGMYVCQVCYVLGNDMSQLEVCPFDDCAAQNFDPYLINEIQKKINFYSIKLQCISQTCPGKN